MTLLSRAATHVRQSAANSSISLATGRQSSPDDWEEVDLSSTEYARRRRELMQLISDLRSMGAQTLMDLPSIVVIGGQSAGKSSLVEAVSGVNVPRDSGTCTRCPMECTMSSSATTWSCKIKLRFDYDSSGRSAVQQKEIAFGSNITDKSEVDVWLRRAQTAILNPGVPPESFYRKSIHELRNFASPTSLKFSRNVVSIFIEDPHATDLSFVDLPGLIQNEETNVLDLVRQLTEDYIHRLNTIILTTIPMSDDMQNQQSVRLAKKADSNGERTIGILTKPDMLGPGAVNARKIWVDVIEGRQHKLKHGYYCVRLPDDAQRAQGLSRSELQRTAAEYFDNTPPWKDVADRGRFGIPAFVSDISVLLVNHINKVLPQLRQDVERLLASCLQEIGTLPKRLEADPQIEVLARVNEFCDAFKGVVSGASSDKSLAQRNRALYTIFAQHIRGTSPDFRPFDQPKQYRRMDPFESEENVADRQIMGASEAYETPSADREFSGECDAYETPSADRQFSEVCEEDETASADGQISEACEEDVTANAGGQIMGVFEVRKIIKESTAWELPGNIPYEAKTRLINQFTDLWFSPAEKCLTSVNDVLDDVIQQLVKKHFGRFKVLHDLISVLIRPDIEEHKDRTLAAVRETLRLEISPAYTQNLNDYQNRTKWLAKYRYARRRPEDFRIYGGPTRDYRYNGMATESVSPVDQALRSLAKAGYTGLTVDDLACLSPRDQLFDEELIVMADVRAYFTIACKRIIDHVPLKIEHSLHHALVDRLSVSLLHRLLADAASTGNAVDRMKELVSEDPETERKRTRLEATRTRLQEMRRRLINSAA